MKTLLFLVPFLVIGCSSTKTDQSIQKVTESPLVQEDQMVGKDLPSWATQIESIRDGRLYMVGYSEMSADKSEHYISKAAFMDAEMKLLSESPTDIREITQNALTGSGMDSSDFVQIQTKLKELVGMKGAKPHEHTCRKFVRYGESRTVVNRACWYQASISLGSFREAYMLTMQKKYGDKKAHQFDDLMKQEINKINDGQRFEKDRAISSSNAQ